MKRIVFISLFSVLQLTGFAQVKKDYENVMRQFVAFYNDRQNDGVCTLFPDETPSYKCPWRKLHGATAIDEYGKIISFEYLGKMIKDPEQVTVFKVNFAKKGIKAMSFNLDKDNKFGTFRLDTTDEEIEEMLKNVK